VWPHLDPANGTDEAGRLGELGVREEADRVLSYSVETGLEGVDSIWFNNTLVQAVPSVNNSLWEEVTSQIKAASTFDNLGWRNLDTTSKRRSRSFILVPTIDFSYTTSYALNRNFCSMAHRLATMHNVTDGRKTVPIARPLVRSPKNGRLKNHLHNGIVRVSYRRLHNQCISTFQYSMVQQNSFRFFCVLFTLPGVPLPWLLGFESCLYLC